MGKMKYIGLTMMLVAGLLGIQGVASAQNGTSDAYESLRLKDMREILRFYEKGVERHSRVLFDEVASKTVSSDPEGWSVLSDIQGQVVGHSLRMESFIKDNPQSYLIPVMRLMYAFNVFDYQEYKTAGGQFALLSENDVPEEYLTEYLFKRAYCDMETHNYADAIKGFRSVEARPYSDYTAPARYAAGYICYVQKDFSSAAGWFEKSVKDGRFSKMSNYYMMECHFMMGDHAYVIKNGDAMYDAVPVERRPHLARIVSESYLVSGDADNARRFYGLSEVKDEEKSRSDWFYSGSVLYAVKDYKGAVVAFSKMGERLDSLGQIASYHMGYSYIQTKDKVSAMEAFKDASQLSYDSDIAEDAFFNWAKLAFDLNNDTSVFHKYLKKYSELEKGDIINSYIAVAALNNRDYEGAVEAYDRIDELDEDMVLNYMKANYLRANQLINSGSYRKAVPCLKAASYYSDKGTKFNQLSRYWLAESYYRNDQFGEARDVFSSLYNSSALFGMPESDLLSYNIAYCYYKEGNYASALRWFTEYLSGKNVKFRKEALERKGDCLFMAKNYASAAKEYDKVLKDYFNVNDIYPYYQAALSHGLNNDSAKKISLLSNVLKASSQSEFYAEALFELGRTYALHDKDDEAMKCFSKLVEEVKDNTFLARSYIEMGTLSRNQSQFNEAIGHYKKVVEDFPLSGFAEDALLAIESIYQARNEPEEYIAYIEKIGKGASKTEDEKENMIFNSAEQIFMSENYQKALVSLQSYGEKYPDGAFVGRTEFYVAECYRHLGKLEQACDVYKKVIGGGDQTLVELSMLHFSDLSYKLEKWSDAFGGYSSLFEHAKVENNRYLALVGKMRSAFRGHDWDHAVKEASKVAADSRTDTAMKEEADYISAKSYLASSRRNEAFVILERLSANVSGQYGAEAAYLLIQDCYDRGDFENVENKVYAFADAASQQTYWLAKSFIVLGDSFVERGEVEQAIATFESVRDGYDASANGDDVMDQVEMRLKKLKDMSASAQN